jgi:hypothetical protein
VNTPQLAELTVAAVSTERDGDDDETQLLSPSSQVLSPSEQVLSPSSDDREAA